ncbi:MAG: hypothetical protein KAH77_12065, partial [Thiomargarita sp.]|nr:hypothetical protein [Thiomargarita sp.]
MSPPMSEKILDFLKSLTTTEKRDIGFYIDTEQRDKIHRDDVLRELSEAPNLCTITEAIRILDNEALAEARDLALVREF